jgi:hypothetical protein
LWLATRLEPFADLGFFIGSKAGEADLCRRTCPHHQAPGLERSPREADRVTRLERQFARRLDAGRHHGRGLDLRGGGARRDGYESERAALRRPREPDRGKQPRNELLLGHGHEKHIARAGAEALVALRGLIALQHRDEPGASIAHFGSERLQGGRQRLVRGAIEQRHRVGPFSGGLRRGGIGERDCEDIELSAVPQPNCQGGQHFRVGDDKQARSGHVPPSWAPYPTILGMRRIQLQQT